MFIKKILLIFISISFFSCSDKIEQSKHYPLLGEEPVKNAVILENSSEVLVSWLMRGYKDMTLVRVGSQDALAYLSEDNIMDLKNQVKDKNWKEIERSVAPGNYLKSAIRIGVVKRIFWVVPNRFFEYSDAERRIKAFLNISPSRFKASDIEKMKLDRRGCVSGRLYDDDISICSAETLPFISEPVTLDIETDFFPVFASERGVTKLRGLKEFFDLMSRKNLRVVSATVSLPRDNPIHDYIGNQVFELLKNPGILKLGEPPELWAVRDNAENMLSSGANKEALEYLKKPLAEHAGEYSLLIFKTVAMVRTGKERDSLAILEGLCREDKNLCRVLILAGSELKKAGKIDASRQFFERAVGLRPDLAAKLTSIE